jgi:hypothetical protein
MPTTSLLPSCTTHRRTELHDPTASGRRTRRASSRTPRGFPVDPEGADRRRRGRGGRCHRPCSCRRLRRRRRRTFSTVCLLRRSLLPGELRIRGLTMGDSIGDSIGHHHKLVGERCCDTNRDIMNRMFFDAMYDMPLHQHHHTSWHDHPSQRQNNGQK